MDEPQRLRQAQYLYLMSLCADYMKNSKDAKDFIKESVSKNGENLFGIYFEKFGSLMKQMVLTLKYLFTGGISLDQLSGPVGIYSVVGEQSKAGIQNVLYLVAFFSRRILCASESANIPLFLLRHSGSVRGSINACGAENIDLASRRASSIREIKSLQASFRS